MAAGARQRVAVAACCGPHAGVAAVVYGTWLAGWARLGRPPRPFVDDPADLGGWFGGVYVAAFVTAGLLSVGWLVALAAVLPGAVRRLRAEGRPTRPLRLAVLGSWAGLGALAGVDPGRVFAWFLDE